MSNSIRGRAKVSANGQAEIRLLINHPMTIERIDPATGKRQPGHFIEEIFAVHKGETVFSALCGQAVSQNPFLAFTVAGVEKGDVITVHWRDTKGENDRADITVA